MTLSDFTAIFIGMTANKRELRLDDTIAALSTPLGEGGISIIRISGVNALDVAKRLFYRGSVKSLKKIRTLASHRVYYGHIVAPESDAVIDEVLTVYMKAPRSYTAEDVVEISCHGGMLSSRRILDAALSSGARLAAPGEFTKRAFLNGRIDLTQAESVIDIIRAQTDRSMDFASHQLSGDLSNEISNIKNILKTMLAYFQASIDFPEDDTDIKYDDYIPVIEKVKSKVADYLATYDEGRIFRAGLSTAIVGKPNVGKSSLLNVLLKEERAIVTDIPGTTRDTIEEVVNIKGIPLRLIDTAGIRNSECVIESAGIKLSRDKIKQADFVLFVLDASAPPDDNDLEIFKLTKRKKKLIVANKSDLVKDHAATDALLKSHFGSTNIVRISAKKNENVEQLRNMIFETVIEKKVEQEKERFLINSRHRDILTRTLAYVEQIDEGLTGRIFPELICVPITDALAALGEVLGETTSDDILHQIFSEFCIGK